MKALRMMLGLFTTIPMGRFEFDAKRYQRSVWMIVLVGLIIAGLMWLLAQVPLPASFRTLFLLLGYLLLTGGFHLDGFGDTLDGMLSRQPRVRALEIMRDPHLGTFGILGLFVYLMLWLQLMALPLPELAFGFPILGRICALLVCYRQQPARTEGMGQMFIAGAKPWMGVIALTSFFGIGLFLGGWQVLWASLAAVVVVFLTEAWIHHRIGGMTGDTIGFSIELSQLVYLIVLGWAVA